MTAYRKSRAVTKSPVRNSLSGGTTSRSSMLDNYRPIFNDMDERELVHPSGQNFGNCSTFLAAMAAILLLIPQASAETLKWGFAVDGFPVTSQQLTAIEKDSGLRATIVVFFMQWPKSPIATNWRPSLQCSLANITAQQAIPCITWEPMYFSNQKETVIAAETITNGFYDTYLTNFTKIIKSYAQPVMLRFAHEMNIERYHWGSADYTSNSPAIYINMHRYLVNFFRRTGVTNALWVFCPNMESLPGPVTTQSDYWNTAGNYYPGDEFVDILGMDGYNWGTTQTQETHGWTSQWRTFRSLFQNLYTELHQVAATNKPVYVFETASVAAGGDKDLWIKEMLQSAQTWSLAGICWFEVEKENNWRLTNSISKNTIELIKQATSPSKE